MDKLTSMKVFVYVAENGSFRQAASYFSVSPTMVGKHIKFLEQSLNTQLIHRTTRSQTLTESGRIYLQECQRILEDIINTESLIHDLESRPSGTIKINAPVTYGKQVLSHWIVEFMLTHPDINIDIKLDNSLIDPYQHDFDFVIRIGALQNSNLVGRHLGDYQMVYCASPAYLQQHEALVSLEQLQHHNCLGFRYHDVATESKTKHTAQDFPSTKTRLSANNGDVLCHAALQGLGVLLQPEMLVEPHLASGALREVLVDKHPSAKPIHLLYKAKQLSVKNRTFAEFIVKKCRDSKTSRG